MKIVSLLPSATEIVYALGLDDDLVGVSCDCDYPTGASTKPVVSHSALVTADSTPADIDREVRASVSASDPIYRLDRELVKRLQPDLILAQDLCRVFFSDADPVSTNSAITFDPAVWAMFERKQFWEAHRDVTRSRSARAYRKLVSTVIRPSVARWKKAGQSRRMRSSFWTSAPGVAPREMM